MRRFLGSLRRSCSTSWYGCIAVGDSAQVGQS